MLTVIEVRDRGDRLGVLSMLCAPQGLGGGLYVRYERTAVGGE